MSLLFTPVQTDEKTLQEKFIEKEGYTVQIEYIAYKRNMSRLRFVTPTECRGIRFSVYSKDIWKDSRSDGEYCRSTIEALDPLHQETFGWSKEEGPIKGQMDLELGVQWVLDKVGTEKIDEFIEAVEEVNES